MALRAIVKLVWFYVNMSSLVASLHLFLFSLCSGWNCTLCFLQGSHFGGLWKAWSGCWLHQCLPRAITNSSASTHNWNSMVRWKKYSHPRYGFKNACKPSLFVLLPNENCSCISLQSVKEIHLMIRESCVGGRNICIVLRTKGTKMTQLD